MKFVTMAVEPIKFQKFFLAGKKAKELLKNFFH
jgi:hypothetical protein